MAITRWALALALMVTPAFAQSPPLTQSDGIVAVPGQANRAPLTSEIGVPWFFHYIPSMTNWVSYLSSKFDVKNDSFVSVKAFGAACDGATNDSAAFAAANASLPHGGVIYVPATGHSCVLSQGIVLGNGVSLVGTAGAHWPSYDDNIESDWTSFGSWVRCDDHVNACISTPGTGSGVRGLNVWQNQPTPTGTNCGSTCTFTHDWTPTAYPPIISIPSGQNFNHFSDINIVNATNCIDMEGGGNGVGSFYTYFDHLQLGCFNTGIKFGQIDNHIDLHGVDFVVLWYQAFSDVWGYMEGDTAVQGHKIDIDAAYLSDASMDGVQFYQSWAAMRFNTASVGSGLGTVTFAGQGIQGTNINFNQVCQAVVLGSGNPILNMDLTNVVLNVDPQTSVVAGQCGQATPVAFNLNSNNADVSITNLNGFAAQTLASVGGGTSGGLHLSGRVRVSYSAFAPSAPAVNVNAGGFIDMANDVNSLFPATGGGPQCAGACRNWPVVPMGDAWVQGAAGTARQQLFLTRTATGGLQTRFGPMIDSTAETGGNVGSNFGIGRYADSGAFLDDPIQITRSSGLVTMPDSVQIGGRVGMPAYTVSTLPACNGASANSFAAVTDATSPAYGAALTGGGGIQVPVFCTGTQWTAH